MSSFIGVKVNSDTIAIHACGLGCAVTNGLQRTSMNQMNVVLSFVGSTSFGDPCRARARKTDWKDSRGSAGLGPEYAYSLWASVAAAGFGLLCSTPAGTNLN